jgi:hypothetical protein
MCVISWGGLIINSSELWFAVATLSFSSAGATIVLVGVANVIIGVVPEERTSEATGISVVLRLVMQAIGAMIIGRFLASSTIRIEGADAAIYSHPDAFMRTIYFIVFVSTLSLFSSCLLYRLQRPAVLGK